jgi:hypothetical protein
LYAANKRILGGMFRMGYMTVTMFLNDAEQNVKVNPTEVATNVHEAMLGVGMSRD